MHKTCFVPRSHPLWALGGACLIFWLALALSACGDGVATPTLATIQGTVTAGPTCPVEIPEGSCAPRPVTDREVNLETKAGVVVEITKTDSGGEYHFSIGPGSYIVHVPIVQGKVGVRQVTPGDATVGAGQTVTLDISLDTGIR